VHINSCWATYCFARTNLTKQCQSFRSCCRRNPVITLRVFCVYNVLANLPGLWPGPVLPSVESLWNVNYNKPWRGIVRANNCKTNAGCARCCIKDPSVSDFEMGQGLYSHIGRGHLYTVVSACVCGVSLCERLAGVLGHYGGHTRPQVADRGMPSRSGTRG